MTRVFLSRIKKKCLKLGYRSYDLIMDTDKYIKYRYYANGYHNPSYHFEKDQICFIHIPKTAGTSFAELLKKDPQQRFIHLNIHKPVSEYCSPGDYKYVTILRDPVERVWSYYWMVLRNPKGYPYRKYAVRGLSPFLDKCWAARNIACRYISGNVDAEPDEATLQKAKQNLERFYAVLSFKDFSRDATDFLSRHDIPFEEIPYERKANYPQPDPGDLQLIRSYNSLDITLFETWQS